MFWFIAALIAGYVAAIFTWSSLRSLIVRVAAKIKAFTGG
jgi:hypothetical protein